MGLFPGGILRRKNVCFFFAIRQAKTQIVVTLKPNSVILLRYSSKLVHYCIIVGIQQLPGLRVNVHIKGCSNAQLSVPTCKP